MPAAARVADSGSSSSVDWSKRLDRAEHALTEALRSVDRWRAKHERDVADLEALQAAELARRDSHLVSQEAARWSRDSPLMC